LDIGVKIVNILSLASKLLWLTLAFSNTALIFKYFL